MRPVSKKAFFIKKQVYYVSKYGKIKITYRAKRTTAILRFSLIQ